MKVEMKKLQDEETNWEQRLEGMARQRQEARDKQNALSWLRTLLFPFVEELADVHGMTIREAADKIVRDRTRIDLLLRQNWENSEIRRLMDSGPARSLLVGSAGLLTETDQKTAEGAQWLLDKVLPDDLEGADIRDAFAASKDGTQLWTDTVVGLKRLFASRIARPGAAPRARRF